MTTVHKHRRSGSASTGLDFGINSKATSDPYEFASPSNPQRAVNGDSRLKMTNNTTVKSSSSSRKKDASVKPNESKKVSCASKRTVVKKASKVKSAFDLISHTSTAVLSTTTTSSTISTAASMKRSASHSVASASCNFNSNVNVSSSSKCCVASEEGPSRSKMIKSVSEPSRSRLLQGIHKRGVYNHRLWQQGDNEEDGSNCEGSATLKKKAVDIEDSFGFVDDDKNETPVTSNKCKKETAVKGDKAAAVASLKTRVPCHQRPLYTVIRHVNDATECQERGETQDFLDEIDYHVDGLRSGRSGATRALSVLSLAEKCASHNFRMLMKSHAVWARVFELLADCTNLPQSHELCLSVSGLFYIMSRDRFNCELDSCTLTLLLRLLGVKASAMDDSIDRVRRKLREILEKCNLENSKRSCGGNSKTIATTLPNLSVIMSRELSLEALLALSFRKASDWFKEAVRLQHGLDHIVKAVSEAVEYFGDDLNAQHLNEFMLQRLNRVESFMRLLENMTYKNAHNQHYMVQHEQGQLLEQLRRCLNLCYSNLVDMDMKVVGESTKERRQVISCLIAVLRLLLNCSHDNSKAAECLGAHPRLVRCVLECVLRLPQHLSREKGFELLVLTLGFLVNLTEHCDENRRRLAHLNVFEEEKTTPPKPVFEALVQLFQERHERACELESEAEAAKEAAKNSRGAGKKGIESEQWRVVEERHRGGRGSGGRLTRQCVSNSAASDEEDDEEEEEDSGEENGADVEFLPSTKEEDEKLQVALNKAGQHMEESMVAAYTALLLGCIVRENRRLADRLLNACGQRGVRPLVEQLDKFLSFMSLTSSVGSQSANSILSVLQLLNELDGGSGAS